MKQEKNNVINDKMPATMESTLYKKRTDYENE